jgi:hypothetical protein
LICYANDSTSPGATPICANCACQPSTTAQTALTCASASAGFKPNFQLVTATRGAVSSTLIAFVTTSNSDKIELIQRAEHQSGVSLV